MPYTLLSSARILSDLPYDFPSDVTTNRDLVVEVVNILAINRRMAGWLYSTVDSGLGDRELADSKRIAFGKNRVNFTTHPLPLRLRFYPMYGLKGFDMNIYSGTNLPPTGTQLNASWVARLDRGVRGGIIQYRAAASSTWIVLPNMGGVAQAYYRPGTNALVVRNHSNEIFFCIVGTWTWTLDTIATLRAVVAETNTRAIVEVNSTQF